MARKKSSANKVTTANKKAIGYIRVSKDEQAKEGVSLDNQRAKIKAYCDLKDLELVEIFSDEGISAKDIKSRPGMQQVIDIAEAGDVDAVVIYKLDRAFRSTTDALKTAEDFKSQGVAFHAIQEEINTSTPMGKFFYTLTAAYAEMERDLIIERTTDALLHKKKKDEKTGGDVPYGYDTKKEDGKLKLVKNAAEQKLIRKMVRMKDKGLTFNKIATEMNRLGHKSKKGGKWYAKTVTSIINRVEEAA